MQLLTFFSPENWEVTMFFPYTSIVVDRIASQNHNYKTKESDKLTELWCYYREIALSKGCELDNKIVFRLTKKKKEPDLFDVNLYLGMCDNIISLGLNVIQDKWLINKELK